MENKKLTTHLPIASFLFYNPVLNSFESVKMSQTLYLKALGLFFARP